MSECCIHTTTERNLSAVRDGVIASVLLLLGALALAAAADILSQAPVPKPHGSGEVGEVIVYGQTLNGPHPLTAGRTAVLPRPQDVAFQLTTAGLGPRLVRVEIEEPDGRLRTLHQARVAAPVRQWTLDYVARLGEGAPDEVVLVVTVEAPHQAPKSRRYGLRLTTRSHRFWDRSNEPARKPAED